MNRDAVDFSMISSIGYDRDNELLEIEFTNGKIYEYLKFPKEEYLALVSADSLGRYFNGHIKGAYKNKLLSDAGDQSKKVERKYPHQIKRILVESRLLKSIGYNAKEKVLAIEFKSDSLYHYYNFPESEYIRLMKSASHGGYFLKKIKGIYEYARVELFYQD